MTYTFQAMLTVHFFARGIAKASPEKRITIYCQLEIAGMHRDTPFSTKLKVPAKYWDGIKVKSSFALAQSINSELLKIQIALIDIWKALPVAYPNKTSFDYHDLRHHYFKKQFPCKRSYSFIELWDMMILQKKIAPSTRRGYRTKRKKILAFLNNEYRSDIDITCVNKRFLDTMHNWLLKDGQSLNVANKYITNARSVLDYAVDQEYLSQFPLGKANLNYTPPLEPKYLKSLHRQAIANVTIQALEKVRDTAIFLMYTGFSYCDYVSLTSKHLISSKGRRCFKKARNKTNIFSMPPLFPEAEEIILKYGSIENLPRIQIDDFNKLLKVLGELAGLTSDTIGFDLSTSVFRETFCSWCENEMMFSERVIMYFMGHTSRRQLNTYSNIQPSRIFREMEMAEKYRKVG